MAVAAPCPGQPDTLGTARILTVDPATTAPVGHKSFPRTLPLAPKEVVLTFDDGPFPATTSAVLEALKRECVLATFFLIGRMAAEHPAMARRILAEGHTVGHHSHVHPILDRMSTAAAEAEIDRGFTAVDTALYGRANIQDGVVRPRTAFFRFPGFASTPVLLDRLKQRGIAVFGTDFWASDWNPMTPDQQLRLVLERLEAAGGGIVLFHDTKTQTAAMIPAFLRALKRGGYSVVHIVPAKTTN
jgi:peptidoglycan/xylan/chitin deacetylase (PgdA/CDA1 family)